MDTGAGVGSGVSVGTGASVVAEGAEVALESVALAVQTILRPEHSWSSSAHSVTGSRATQSIQHTSACVVVPVQSHFFSHLASKNSVW